MDVVAAELWMLVFFGLILGLPVLWQWRLDAADKKSAESPGLSQDFRAMLDKDAELKAWWEDQMKLTRADELPEMEEVRNVTEEARNKEVLGEAVLDMWQDIQAKRTEVPEVRELQGDNDDERTIEAWCGCSWTTRGGPDDWERKYHCPRHRPERTICMHGGSICF